MKLHRISTASLLVLVSLAACSGEKVKPDENVPAAADPAIATAIKTKEYQAKQAAFTDSVLKNTKSASQLVSQAGKGYAVGTVQMRDSLVKYVAATPSCMTEGRKLDPYLAGTVTFFVNMGVVGSDVVRVHTSEWTSQAGKMVDKCFNEASHGWKFPMGIAKPASYLLQVQFKPDSVKVDSAAMRGHPTEVAPGTALKTKKP